MVKRNTKRKSRKIVLIISLSILAVILTAGVAFFLNKVSPLLVSKNFVSPTKIINPLVVSDVKGALRKKLSDKNILFDSFVVASDSASIVGKIKDGPVVYFSTNSNVDWLVTSLELILTRLTVGGKKPSVIDLTGQRPIVKF